MTHNNNTMHKLNRYRNGPKLNRQQIMKIYRLSIKACLRNVKKIFVEPIYFTDAVNT